MTNTFNFKDVINVFNNIKYWHSIHNYYTTIKSVFIDRLFIDVSIVISFAFMPLDFEWDSVEYYIHNLV